ncbi:alanine acetyltransferase [Pseudoxanthomonas yeongjuensis]|uniref:alanine acetyltransferase n=1 Tax=Pseudoxanthomonas yeongjuensis TaxID=377616 RepID=UPI001FE7FA52|nr:alanine acetyltransferase [Pseudoxanthomonas yeongjuensis]
MSELWSSQQHEWLAALGHTLYVQGTAEAPVARALEPVAASREPASRELASQEPASPAQAPARHASKPESAEIRVRVAEPAPHRAASRLPDKLHFALIRASGCNPNAEDAAAIMAQWPPSHALRGNPAAKRALWPQLRALRRKPLP